MNTEIRHLIRRMSLANPLWGAPRIHGELLKLGIDVSQATVGRHMPWRPKVPSPTWRSFLQNFGVKVLCIFQPLCSHATVPKNAFLSKNTPTNTSAPSLWS
jgi:hypothetical protein